MALEGLRNSNITFNNWRLFLIRVVCNLPRVEVKTFNNALRVYSKKNNVNKYNHEKMLFFNVPVKQIYVIYIGISAEKATFDKGRNFYKIILICIGARVMFTENKWIECGLVNSVMGIVKDFN